MKLGEGNRERQRGQREGEIEREEVNTELNYMDIHTRII